MHSHTIDALSTNFPLGALLIWSGAPCVEQVLYPFYLTPRFPCRTCRTGSWHEASLLRRRTAQPDSPLLASLDSLQYVNHVGERFSSEVPRPYYSLS